MRTQVIRALVSSALMLGCIFFAESTAAAISAGTLITNIAQTAYLQRGQTDPRMHSSNPVQVVISPVIPERIGVAQSAGSPLYERYTTTGGMTGIASVHLSFVVQSFSAQPMTAVQVMDVLEGAARLGTAGSPTTLGPGQYAVVPGSMRIDAVHGQVVAQPNPQYDGTAAQSALLASGASLSAGASFQISFDVRVNATGLNGTIYNTAQASATGTAVQVRDDSVDGTVPDANGDGDPTNDTSPTPIPFGLPSIEITKAAGEPRRLSGGDWEVDFTVTVSNPGKSVASYVRVADNLNCTFRNFGTSTAVQSWQLVGTPSVGHGLLRLNSGFNGSAPCTAQQAQDANPYTAMPGDASVMLTDGSMNLAPGASEVLRFSVRFSLASQVRAQDLSFTNTAFAAVYDKPGADGARLAAALSRATIGVLDPSGVVYHAVTRQPIAGALVTLRRLSCQSGSPGPITSDQLVPKAGVNYTFNADGSVSMLSEPLGHYHFYLASPPVGSVCEYGLAVTPPPGGGLEPQSKLIAPTSGDAPAGLVQRQPTPPTGGDPTTYYLLMRLGPDLGDVWNNHIPLDPAGVTPPSGALFLEKKASRVLIEIGDSVEYTLSLKNNSPSKLTGFVITDQMPPGFRYLAGSSRLNGQAVGDPAVDRLTLRFDQPAATLGAGDSLTIVYRTQSGPATPLGDAINTAQASGGGMVSNTAIRKVRVEGGVFSDEAYLVGKVYLDCNGNGVQDKGEVGIPGVRLLLEDGTGVVTDVEGKYSLYGLRAITHVLKLDATTLPAGAELSILDNRNAGQADSRFVDLKKGELHKGDFTVGSCTDPKVVAEVQRRRSALADRPDAEGIAVSRAKLGLQPQPLPVDQVRTRDASGLLTASGPTKPNAGAAAAPAGAAPVFESVMPRELAQSATQPPTEPVPPKAGLENLLPDLDNTLAFIDLKNGDTLPMAIANVRVKGFLGSRLQLVVNGTEQGDTRVGKRSRIVAQNVEAWEYIGVELKPGENTLVLNELDVGGNRRASVSIVVVAPGRPGRVEIDAPQTALADGATRVPIKVRLTDDKGVPVTARTQLTLEVDNGRWDVKDLNPDEPGTQVFMEGGQAEFGVLPPNDPLDATIRISAGSMRKEVRLAYLPELRPLIGSGILEGVLDFRRKGVLPVGQTSRDAFEQTLRTLSRQSSDGTRSATARLAFYLKGTIKGEYLLTAAYDSDKSTRERLFRDIQPDKFYPIYGDSSMKLFDAQSTERLYLRVDKAKSWLLFGDFVTTPDSGDVRKLSQYSRAATGVKGHYEDAKVSGNAFARRDTLTQIVLEFPANGTSGPYHLDGGGALTEGSERVEILVRDRRQPSVILRTIPAARFSDYILEPLTKQLRFAAPVASMDENLNPRFIRVTYEADTGGPSFWVAGGDVQLKVSEQLQLGVSIARDQNPANPTTIGGATAVIKLDPKSVVTAEIAKTDTGESGSGTAGRIEWLKETERLKLRAQATISDSHFDNITSGFSKGRTEATLDSNYQIDAKTTAHAEAIYSKDQIAGQERVGALATITRPLSENLRGEVGIRMSRDTAPILPITGPEPSTPVGTSTDHVDILALRARLNARVPQLGNAQMYTEVEQDVRESKRHLLAVGGEYQLSGQARVYGRYELISSLGNPYALNSAIQNNIAVLGIETSYLQNGRTFNEFRLRDAINGREFQAASGVRRTWVISPGLRVGGSFESTRAFGGVPGSNSMAVTGTVEYNVENKYRVYGSLEARDADTGNSWLATLGGAYKINADWSLLGRTATSMQKNSGDGSSLLLSREQIGVAWRQVDIDRWNALARYEHSLSEVSGGPNPHREAMHAVSVSVNYQPSRSTILNGRYAFKWGENSIDEQTSSFRGHLLYGRWTQDVTRKVDVSLQAAGMWGTTGSRRTALGLEAGLQVVTNLWVSLGFNVVGLSRDAVASGEYLDRGLYLRLRYKFDEGTLK